MFLNGILFLVPVSALKKNLHIPIVQSINPLSNEKTLDGSMIGATSAMIKQKPRPKADQS